MEEHGLRMSENIVLRRILGTGGGGSNKRLEEIP
jgi:hypothetical protein